MKFALHMGTLRGFGSSAVGRNIWRQIRAIAPHHEFTAWIPRDPRWTPLADPRTLGVNKGLSAKFIAENWTIRRALTSGHFDALFSMGDTSLPFCPVPHMLMVHQAHLAYAPSTWGFEVSRAFRLKIALMEQYFRLGLHTVDTFTVQTKSMKRQLCARWDIPDSRVAVVPSFLDIDLSSISSAAPEHHDEPYICYVASAAPHKNFAIFAPMMASLTTRWPSLQCRLTVNPDQVPDLVRRARALGVIDRFRFCGRVDDIRPMLTGASAFIMPSKLESFGLPYFEAMAAGCPIVAADRDFAREACGDAAIYAQADAPEDFADAVDRLLTSPTLAEHLVEIGFARVKAQAWSWQKAAEQYIHLLEDLGSRSSGGIV